MKIILIVFGSMVGFLVLIFVLMVIAFHVRNMFGRLHGFPQCGRCGATSDWMPMHETPYGLPVEQQRRCVCLCELCWGKLSIEDRLPYYERHVHCSRVKEPWKWHMIRRAVEEGK